MSHSPSYFTTDSNSSSIPLSLTKPTRHRTIPSRLIDYTGLPSHLVSQSAASNAGLLTGTSCNYPIQNYISYAAFTSSCTKYLAATVQPSVPYTYKQAATDHNWLQAMKLEINALENNYTWDIGPKPSNQHIIDCTWLFKIKYKPDGTIERYKARLVAKGFTQTFGLDYFETFAPVAKMITVRVRIGIAATQDWPISQLDVTNALLHGDLNENVNMKLPTGYLHLSSSASLSGITDPTAFVCKLRKSLYGLRQAPRCWFTKFSTALKEYGFLQSHTDNSLFTFNRDNKFVDVLVYVDDILVTGSNKELIQQVIAFLATKFKVKDLGPLKYLLRIEVARSTSGIYLHQRKYTLDILKGLNHLKFLLIKITIYKIMLVICYQLIVLLNIEEL